MRVKKEFSKSQDPWGRLPREGGSSVLGRLRWGWGSGGHRSKYLCKSLKARNWLYGKLQSLAGADGLGKRGTLGQSSYSPDVPTEGKQSCSTSCWIRFAWPAHSRDGPIRPQGCQGTARCIPLATCQLSSSALPLAPHCESAAQLQQSSHWGFSPASLLGQVARFYDGTVLSLVLPGITWGPCLHSQRFWFNWSGVLPGLWDLF